MVKGFSSSCERNQQPILEQLTRLLKDSLHVLEIGSGTGQHAVFFAQQLPHLLWYSSDTKSNHASIKAWMEEFPSSNLVGPIEYLVGQHPWPTHPIDSIFTANTTHIMQVDEAQLMMEIVAQKLPEGGLFCQYGPFNIDGQYTSASNRDFDQHLKDQGCGGIRDIAELCEWGQGLSLIEKIQMPANNFLLVWQSL